MPRLNNLSGRIFAVAAASAVVYLALATWTGWDQLSAQIAGFPLAALPVLVALSLANYSLRFWRWQLLLRTLAIRIPVRASLSLFLATFLMVITPGKLGEVFKAGVLRERHGVALGLGLPVVMAERIYDFLGVLLLAAAGWAAWPGPAAGVGAGLLASLSVPAGLIAFRSARLRGVLLRQATRAPQLSRFRFALDQALAALARLLSFRLALASLVLSTLAWGCECVSLWVICTGLKAGVAALAAVFVYAAGTLVGSLVFLPGGLGGTEATMIWLLGELGCTRDLGVAATLLVRLVTLWLAVGIGVVVYTSCRAGFTAVPSSEADRPPEPLSRSSSRT
jgi:glycosyltransferase 2 family protein